MSGDAISVTNVYADFMKGEHKIDSHSESPARESHNNILSINYVRVVDSHSTETKEINIKEPFCIKVVFALHEDHDGIVGGVASFGLDDKIL